MRLRGRTPGRENSNHEGSVVRVYVSPHEPPTFYKDAKKIIIKLKSYMLISDMHV